MQPITFTLSNPLDRAAEGFRLSNPMALQAVRPWPALPA